MAFGRITLNEQITPSKWPSLRSSTKKARQKADPASLMFSGFPKLVTMAIRRCFVCPPLARAALQSRQATD
jgi:hypothetical protein